MNALLNNAWRTSSSSLLNCSIVIRGKDDATIQQTGGWRDDATIQQTGGFRDDATIHQTGGFKDDATIQQRGGGGPPCVIQ